MSISLAPERTLIEVSGKQIWDAIEMNGLEYIREEWFDSNLNPVAACILGQGAYNLGVVGQMNSYSMHKQLDMYADGAARKIIFYFDSYTSVEDGDFKFLNEEDRALIYGIAETNTDLARKEYIALRNKYIDTVAPDQIGYLDANPVFLDGTTLRDDTKIYTHSVKDTLKFAKEVLTPFFDTVFKLQTQEYVTRENE